ncbi:hypothetical protein BH10PSE13_BH10PSE13_25350 [soil metagenome]
MAVAQRTRARKEWRGRRQGALIAAAVTVLCLIAIPVELLELGIASIGLSELLPVLAPPIGWPVRIVLVLVGAAIAAALSAALGGGGSKDNMPGAKRPGRKGNDSMGWAKSLGLHHLARLARGEEAASHAAASTPRAPTFPKPELVADADLLPRRRGDMHPDAPPRAPLIASRDLPAAIELTVVETGPASAPPPVPPMPYVSPVRDTTHEDRPRPLPRSPEPLSDSDLGWVRGLLAPRREQSASFTDEMSEAPLLEASAGVTPASGMEGSLLAMVDRFEQGVSRRIALLDSANAIARLDGDAAFAAPVACDPEAPLDEAQEIDGALDAALETLKKLSTKVR